MTSVFTDNWGYLGEFDTQTEAFEALKRELLANGICEDCSSEGFRPFDVNYECIPHSKSCKLTYTTKCGDMQGCVMTWDENIPW